MYEGYCHSISWSLRTYRFYLFNHNTFKESSGKNQQSSVREHTQQPCWGLTHQGSALPAALLQCLPTSPPRRVPSRRPILGTEDCKSVPPLPVICPALASRLESPSWAALAEQTRERGNGQSDRNDSLGEKCSEMGSRRDESLPSCTPETAHRASCCCSEDELTGLCRLATGAR